MEPKKKKNFTYGDVWTIKEIKQSKDGSKRRVVEDIAKFTSNTAFINFVKEHHYSFILDYGYPQLAHTDPTHREIVVNANYSDKMISAFIQHEMGHLLLFDVNQFTTVREKTLRSVISKILYTSENVKKFGIQQLLFTENVIQDIIIESVSNGDCICHNSLNLYGENYGVKHLEELESAAVIAREVCSNILEPLDEKEHFAPENQLELSGLLESMLRGLEADSREIQEEIEKTKQSKKFLRELRESRIRKTLKKERMKNKLNKKIDKAFEKGVDTSKLERMRDELLEELKELKSKARETKEREEAERRRNREIERLSKALQKNNELREELEKAADENAAGQGSGNSENSQNSGSSEEKKPELNKNLTDHLLDQTRGNGQSHSCDCGFPTPVTVTRDESKKNETNLVRMAPKLSLKKVLLNEDDSDNVLSNRNKIPENEFTYFKSSKKEFSMADMMKGKRKLRVSGVNVLIGLDISGSMNSEWTRMFKELSEMVRNLKETLDIENIVYFTYNHTLVKVSKNLDDLSLRASGGNAFGYVYQELMKKAPILQKNEIILVTDCGDNLGFSLDASCGVERNGETVKNHISIVDTENAGFYDRTGVDPDDWSLYRYDDKDLGKHLKANIQNLIEG
jgi:hypothetical protein